MDARSIFLVIGLIVGGLGGWGIAQLGDSNDSADQVLAASETGAEPSETSPATEDTQQETGDPGDGTTTPTSSSTTTTTTAAGSEPATEGTPTSSSTTTTTTTTLATGSGPTTTTTTTAEPTPTSTTTTTTAAETPTATSTTTTTTTTAAPTPTTDPAEQSQPTTTTVAPPPASDEVMLATTTVPAAIQLSGCSVPWAEGVRCVVARGVNHPPGEYGTEQTTGAWSCTIELPELRASQSFDYMICPPTEIEPSATGGAPGTQNYVPPENRRLYGLNQVQEFVGQLDDCQMETRLVDLPISVISDGVTTQVDSPAIEHILHCVLRQ